MKLNDNDTVRVKVRTGTGKTKWHSGVHVSAARRLFKQACLDGNLYWFVVDIGTGFWVWSHTAGKWYFRKTAAWWFE